VELPVPLRGVTTGPLDMIPPRMLADRMGPMPPGFMLVPPVLIMLGVVDREGMEDPPREGPIPVTIEEVLRVMTLCCADGKVDVVPAEISMELDCRDFVRRSDC